MNNMKQCLCVMIFFMPIMLSAQYPSTSLNMEVGIQWTKGLSWEQVKQKAKQENKYIFLDCYATWCGPCKMMDKSTYLNDSVGNYFNNKFISVKVQMDKTAKDDENTKKWYNDADSIGKKNHVEGYPTYIFFTPQGEIVHKAMGFKPASDFIVTGKLATLPGKVYTDGFVEYDSLVIAYRNGIMHYDKLPFMIGIASQLDTSLRAALMKTHVNYVSSLSARERYTKANIEFWSSLVLSSKKQFFQFFYRDGKSVDRVMGYKGYAAEVIDRTIQKEICIPYMEAQSKGVAMRGMYLNGPGLKSNESEADWQKLYSMVKKNFGKSYAKRAVLTARIEWYNRHRNYTNFIKYSLMQFEKYPPDLSNTGSLYNINSVCWNAFLYLTDKKTLETCIPWSEKVVRQYPNGGWIDTYANLLYKVGKVKEAIEWQQKALSLAPGNKRIREALDNMKQGKPTHGAKWENWN